MIKTFLEYCSFEIVSQVYLIIEVVSQLYPMTFVLTHFMCQYMIVMLC